jgi:signal transduction histidine kinase/CheY-like chemotaxis protein/HPt (histidine-containing phosphotransfer) domain-containing protein
MANKYDQQVASERLHLLYNQSAPASVISLLNSMFVCWLVWEQVPVITIASWFFFIVLATLVRISLFYAYFKAAPEGAAVLEWQRPYAVTLLFNGLVWGIGGWYLSLGIDLEYQMGIYFFLMGMSAGAISVYSSLRYLALATIYLILLPITLSFLFAEHNLQVILALGTCTFLLSILRSSKVLSDNLNHSYLLTLQLREEKNKSESGRLKAEQAVAARGQFVASISHEIRTPLNTILGMIDLLKGQVTTPQSKAMVAALDESGGHLASLVDNVLDFSKIDTGELELRAHPFSVKVMLQAVIDIFKESAKAKDLTLNLDVNDISNDYWYGDEQRIRQVVINLVGNSVKYTQQGGVFIKASVKPRNGGIHVSVKDTGIGIAPEKLGHVFEAYSQLNDQNRDGVSSTGLGLSISHRLVSAMGGDISFSSQQHLGSEFRVDLPLAPCPEDVYLAQLETPVQELLPLQGKRLLIAEDTPLTQKLIAMFMQDTDLHVDFVDNGRQVIEAVKDKHYDGIIMDVQMPELGGMQAMQEVHAWQLKNAKPLVPVIIQTADNRVETKKRALAMGAQIFLPKPYTRSLFLGAINKLLKDSENKPKPQANEELASLRADLIAELGKSLSLCDDALAAEDINEIKQQAHNIKGYAGLFQEQSLVALATELEQSCESDTGKGHVSVLLADMRSWLDNHR